MARAFASFLSAYGTGRQARGVPRAPQRWSTPPASAPGARPCHHPSATLREAHEHTHRCSCCAQSRLPRSHIALAAAWITSFSAWAYSSLACTKSLVMHPTPHPPFPLIRFLYCNCIPRQRLWKTKRSAGLVAATARGGGEGKGNGWAFARVRDGIAMGLPCCG